MNEWATLEEIEQAIYDEYVGRTKDIIRVLGREQYLRNPVVIQEVGYIADLWNVFDYEIAKEES